MKKIAIILLSVFALTACEDDGSKSIEFSKLPTKAQAFVKAHFSDRNIAIVFCDEDLFDTDYEVRFEDGTNAAFDSDGDWTSVEARNGNGVPMSVMPAGINSFVASKHANNYVVDVDKERRSYEVELNNGIDIVFDKSGNFKYYDD